MYPAFGHLGKGNVCPYSRTVIACRQCGKPFTEEHAWIEPKRRGSSACELHIYEQCKHTDQAAVAEREGLRPETVKTVFQRWAKRAEKLQVCYVVRCLGVDEISLRKGHQQFAMVLTDLERHCVVAVLAERTQKVFEEWLVGLRETERQANRLVAMDMWGLYPGVVKSKLLPCRDRGGLFSCDEALE